MRYPFGHSALITAIPYTNFSQILKFHNFCIFGRIKNLYTSLKKDYLGNIHTKNLTDPIKILGGDTF